MCVCVCMCVFQFRSFTRYVFHNMSSRNLFMYFNTCMNVNIERIHTTLLFMEYPSCYFKHISYTKYNMFQIVYALNKL